ncbi:hypothetical protein M5K25_022628 [Dendrobium thyrsiflorum]|uniref:Uncharacterized protein n=1 Tax=Dendrobium thyrsiflorum TaxID=117978 RepID=A0ABD0U6N3_DENTH
MCSGSFQLDTVSSGSAAAARQRWADDWRSVSCSVSEEHNKNQDFMMFGFKACIAKLSCADLFVGNSLIHCTFVRFQSFVPIRLGIPLRS